MFHLIGESTNNINPRDLNEVTPLHVAANGGHLQICRAIIEKLIDKNPKCNAGVTPLHRAAESGRVGIYQLIIKHVEDKNPETAAGLTQEYPSYFQTIFLNHFT